MRYELRTKRGTPFMAFDDEVRARDYQARHAKRVGVMLQLYRIKVVEELVA